MILRRLYRNVNAKHLKKFRGNFETFIKNFQNIVRKLTVRQNDNIIIVYYYVFQSFRTQHGGWSHPGVLGSLVKHRHYYLTKNSEKFKETVTFMRNVKIKCEYNMRKVWRKFKGYEIFWTKFERFIKIEIFKKSERYLRNKWNRYLKEVQKDYYIFERKF